MNEYGQYKYKIFQMTKIVSYQSAYCWMAWGGICKRSMQTLIFVLRKKKEKEKENKIQ